MQILLLKTDRTILVDKFLVKTPAVSSTKKASSHLPPNMTAHNRARKYPEGTFQVDDGLMFCWSWNIVIDHLRKPVVDKHFQSVIYRQREGQNQGSKQQMQCSFKSLCSACLIMDGVIPEKIRTPPPWRMGFWKFSREGGGQILWKSRQEGGWTWKSLLQGSFWPIVHIIRTFSLVTLQLSQTLKIVEIFCSHISHLT